MTSTPSRRAVQALVIITTFVCLGVVGYAGQVWWAKRLAREHLRDILLPGAFGDFFSAWKTCPWYGRAGKGRDLWVPRRAFRECLALATGQDMGDDPEAWRGWFKAHPVLVWDKNLKRLVDKPMKHGEHEWHYDPQSRIECPVILPEGGP